VRCAGKARRLLGITQTQWSGRRDLNPRLRPWQGRTLPLSYSRSASSIINERSGPGNDENLRPSLLLRRPLRIFFRPDDMSVAHMNDSVAVLGRLGIVRNHQHSLP
jgi:hypothetical protein